VVTRGSSETEYAVADPRTVHGTSGSREVLDEKVDRDRGVSDGDHDVAIVGCGE
jgi:hypothetical protein